MTREEAIKRLEDTFEGWNMWVMYNDSPASKMSKALGMAISALREQSGSFQNGNNQGEAKDWPAYLDLPKKSATDTNVGNKWISVEERLPEDGVDVLTRRAVGMSVEAHCGWGWTEDGYHTKWRVTHWMPLPEPPEVEV